VKKLFNQTPKVFRNSELIFNNELADFVESLGYKGVITNGAEHVLGWRSPNYVYRPIDTSKVSLLLKNFRLSEDIEYRFSDKSWDNWPLTPKKYASWVTKANGNGDVVNLFMNYEVMGEMNRKGSGIFKFMKAFPLEVLKHKDNDFKTPSEVVKTFKPVADLDIDDPVSSDNLSGMSSWLGNNMQHAAINRLYLLEEEIKATNDPKLIEDWRRMQTSNHFHSMSTAAHANNGNSSSVYHDSPYDSFINYMNIMNDLSLRLKTKNSESNAKIDFPLIEQALVRSDN